MQRTQFPLPRKFHTRLLTGRVVGHPEIIHFICRAEPPGDRVWAFSGGPTGDESASPPPASRPCQRQVCPSPSVSHNSGAEEPAGELSRTDVPKSEKERPRQCESGETSQMPGCGSCCNVAFSDSRRLTDRTLPIWIVEESRLSGREPAASRVVSETKTANQD